MPPLRKRTGEPKWTQQGRKTEISLQQPRVPAPKFCGRIYQQCLGFKDKRAGFETSHRLHRDTGNRTNTGYRKRFCHFNLKKTEGWSWQVNQKYIQEHQVKEVDVVSSEQVDLDGAEMDEMWSFVHDKSQQYWL